MTNIIAITTGSMIIGAVLAMCGIDVMERPLLFFALDIPLALLWVFICNKYIP